MHFRYLAVIFMLGVNPAFAQTETDVTSELAVSYAKYAACVDAISSAYFFDGSTAQESTERGVKTCRAEKKEYVRHLVPDVENRVGRSLNRTEIRRIDRKVEADIQNEFYLIYSGRN